MQFKRIMNFRIGNLVQGIKLSFNRYTVLDFAAVLMLVIPTTLAVIALPFVVVGVPCITFTGPTMSLYDLIKMYLLIFAFYSGLAGAWSVLLLNPHQLQQSRVKRVVVVLLLLSGISFLGWVISTSSGMALTTFSTLAIIINLYYAFRLFSKKDLPAAKWPGLVIAFFALVAITYGCWLLDPPDKEVRAYVKEAIPHIVGRWDVNDLRTYSGAAIQDALDGKEKDSYTSLFAKAARQLGTFKKLDDCQIVGPGHITGRNFCREFFDCTAKASFEKGTGVIETRIYVIDDHKFKVTSFNIEF